MLRGFFIVVGNGENGGAIDNASGTLTVLNSTISGNTATGPDSAGGIHLFQSVGTITNSTITGNTASGPTSGSGLCLEAGSSMTVRNTIVAANRNNGAVPEVFVTATGGPFTSSGFNLVGNRGAVTTFNQATDQTGTGAAPLNPQLGSLANNGGPTLTCALLANSPALDAGNSSGANTDQRGQTRPFDTPGLANVSDGADIGAVEMQSVIVANANDSGAGSLRQAILSADTINFAPAFFNVARTITLTSGELVITQNLTITGPGANLLTVSGNNASRVFTINANSTVSLSGMTITNGSAPASEGAAF